MAAEWSEHCSYKSSKKHLGMLPGDGPLVIREKGYDSGVLDVGGGYVVTAHIESHNHPSAVEPYGGAATGVGGVIRDILSAGTRPIAILDGLRFGDIERDAHARWLFRNAVSGISDYGNCLGIPTVGGEAEFDECYGGYALVDVAAVGFGRRERLVKNRAAAGDAVLLIGGPTGRDGIGGAQFASDQLESQDRSAVQIPDPFIEKLTIEAILEARNGGLIHAMKDLGGGGLSCAISETADALGVGIDVDVSKVHTRERGLPPGDIMVSESQERMLVITPAPKAAKIAEICAKFGVSCSEIGSVRGGGLMRVTDGANIIAEMPAALVANATLLDLPSRKPAYIDTIRQAAMPAPPTDHAKALYRLLGAPNIASKAWVYRQYDHEVGIRTVQRPGQGAAVLRLDNGRYLAVTMDGNPKHCYLDPRQGAAGCFEEACRNVACAGARPAGMLDHLQFGSPRDPGIFWTFLESLGGLADYARELGVPCIGGKVSLYNETAAGPIKPSPVICVLGLADRAPQLGGPAEGDSLVLVGETHDELGGSEYLEYLHHATGGNCPIVRHADSKANMGAVLDIVGAQLAGAAHDCSKGGLAVAVSEMAMAGNIGCKARLGDAPSAGLADDRLLYSETHSRYLLAVSGKNLGRVEAMLNEAGASYGVMGEFGGDSIEFSKGKGAVAGLRVDKARELWAGRLEELVSHG